MSIQEEGKGSAATRKRRPVRAVFVGMLAVGLVALAVSSGVGRGQARAPMFTDIATTEMAQPQGDSQGVCWGDLDGDGAPDLFVAGTGRHVRRLWRNERDGRFTDVTVSAGLTGPALRRAIACALVDVDNDGDLDLHVVSRSNGIPKHEAALEGRLFRNDGGWKFVDVTAAAGVGMPGLGAASVDWADFDRDGDLDAFVATRTGGGPNAFFEQQAKGAFTDRAVGLGLADPVGYRYTYLGSWFDYDGDGDVDLLLAIDFWGIDLYRNDNSSFVRVTQQAFPRATDDTPGAPPNNPMGVTWGDYDGDGCFDLFVSGWNLVGQAGFDTRAAFGPDSPSRLYRSNCDGTFTDATRTAGLIPTGLVEWSAHFVDFDNDGDLDLSVVAGNAAETVPPHLRRVRGRSRRLISLTVTGLRKLVPPGWVATAYRYEAMIPASGSSGVAAAMPSFLYRNLLAETGTAQFVDVTRKVGIGNVGANRGSAWADIDNDGDLDWFIAGRRTPNRLFRNDGPVGHHLRVHLVGGRPRDAVGAWVKIKAGGRAQVRHVRVLDGYLSQSQMDPHFGLGNAETVDEVWVRWPGTTAWVLTCKTVPANRTVTIVESAGCRL